MSANGQTIPARRNGPRCAAAVASGGAMIAMQAAGAGMALNSAYQQTKINMAESMGKFAGAVFTGGFSGAMDKGLTFASDMMSNLVSGVKDTASDNLQKTTAGGRMAANIDAGNTANLAMKAGAEENDSGTAALDTNGPGGLGGDAFSSNEAISEGNSNGTSAYDSSKVGLPDYK